MSLYWTESIDAPRSLNGMKLTFAQFLSKRPRHSKRLLPRMFAAVLCVFFLTAVPAVADTVSINQVVQTHKGSAIDLKLNTLVSQDPAGSGTKVSTQQNGPRNEFASAQTPGGPKTEALISNVVVTSQGQDIGIDIEADVEGTICDCGEILVAGAGFPKWPFFFIAAVPLVFISDCDDCDEPPSTNPTPTPTPNASPTPPEPVPEPATLLLFGSGLLATGAGLRRRAARAKLAAQNKTREEE